MNSKNWLDRCASAILVLSVGVVVSGTKACQEDYEVGVQAAVPTGTVTATVTPTSGANTSSSNTSASSSSVSSSAAQSSDDEATADGVSGEDDLFQELSKLGANTERVGAAAGGAAGVAGGAAGSVKGANWLGDAFSKDEDGSWQDADGDGFGDTLEEDSGSDPNNVSQFPRGAVVTRLAERVPADALTAEALKEAGDIVDSDRDGVSDETEEKRGMNPQSVDSDGDGLQDNRELAVGSNPLRIDSDGDGVSDGREYDLGADPAIPEPRRGID
jgi:hypothetical protein